MSGFDVPGLSQYRSGVGLEDIVQTLRCSSELLNSHTSSWTSSFFLVGIYPYDQRKDVCEQ